MSSDYNYAVFSMANEEPHFEAFTGGLHVGQRAPTFPLEDLDSGQTVAMSDLWSQGLAVLEFGSFT